MDRMHLQHLELVRARQEHDRAHARLLRAAASTGPRTIRTTRVVVATRRRLANPIAAGLLALSTICAAAAAWS